MSPLAIDLFCGLGGKRIFQAYVITSVIDGRQYVGITILETEGGGYFMFQISKYFNRESDLTPMIEHFKRLGIRTEIREDGPRGRRYSLWREGEEATGHNALYEPKTKGD